MNAVKDGVLLYLPDALRNIRKNMGTWMPSKTGFYISSGCPSEHPEEQGTGREQENREQGTGTGNRFVCYYMMAANFKDRRVDNAVKRLCNGKCDIFYSPITIWFSLFLMYIIACIFILLWAANYIGYLPIALIILAYFFTSYAVASYMNNSFVITDNELIIVNPNYPFRRCLIFPLDRILKIKLESKKPGCMTLLGISSRNYIEVKTLDNTSRFYCEELQMDAFDENLTQNTLDDFEAALKKKLIKTQSKLL